MVRIVCDTNDDFVKFSRMCCCKYGVIPEDELCPTPEKCEECWNKYYTVVIRDKRDKSDSDDIFKQAKRIKYRIEFMEKEVFVELFNDYGHNVIIFGLVFECEGYVYKERVSYATLREVSEKELCFRILNNCVESYVSQKVDKSYK